MSNSIITTQPSGDISIDDGTYAAVVSGWDFTTGPDGREDDPLLDKFGPRLEIRFELPDILTDEGEPVVRRLRCNSKVSPKTNTWKWLEKILGRRLDVGENIDLDTLISRQCLVSIENKTSANGNVWATIVAVLAVPRGQETAA